MVFAQQRQTMGVLATEAIIKCNADQRTNERIHFLMENHIVDIQRSC